MGYISSGQAAKNVADQYRNAEQGVVNAVSSGNAGIQSQLGKAYNDVGAAGANVNAATTSANSTLSDYLKGIQGNLQPGVQSGVQGNTALQAYAASNPQFKFNVNDYLNSPAFNFQLQQGTNQIQNQLSASGLGSSGNADKAMEDYRQGLASTYYNQAFNQAQSQFQTNQNTTLANLEALINSGNASNTLNNQAVLNIGGQQSANTIGAANTNAGLQEYLASLGLQGNEFGANLGLQGAKMAGDYAVGMGNAQATGKMNQAAALSSMGTDLAGAVMGFL